MHMKRKFDLWICLWLLIGGIAIFAIFNDKKIEQKNADYATYAERCDVISGTKCLSLEQAMYIAKAKLTCKEIDEFSQICGFILREQSDRDNFTSTYGFDNFKYYAIVKENDRGYLFYSFFCHLDKAYIEKLRSDLKSLDGSAKEIVNNINSGTLTGDIEGYESISLNWTDDGVLIAITVEA